MGAIKAISGLKTKVKYDIYGPQEDFEYWQKCEIELKKLPNNIDWHYKGDVPSEKVQRVLQKYNVLLLPTLGENYGHVIFEALSVGCIPIISDQTSWNDLTDKNAGFVLPLSSSMNDFSTAINEYFSYAVDKRRFYAHNAISIAEKKVADSRESTGYRKIFEGILL